MKQTVDQKIDVGSYFIFYKLKVAIQNPKNFMY